MEYNAPRIMNCKRQNKTTTTHLPKPLGYPVPESANPSEGSQHSRQWPAAPKTRPLSPVSRGTRTLPDPGIPHTAF